MALEAMRATRCLEAPLEDPTPFIPSLPNEVCVHILEYLTKPELVHHVSLVSLTWCRASRQPVLWPVLDASVWKKHPRRLNGNPPTTIFRMKKFYEFLCRPQFSQLRKLVPPDIVRTLHRNIFDRIAAIAPHLQELDLSGCTSIRWFSLIAWSGELPRLPHLFTNLCKI